MGKRNKIRYQSKPKEKKLIGVTGKIFLKYRDEEAMALAVKGDLMLWPQNEALNTTHEGEYGSNGFAGYFKVDINDGKTWQPVLTNDIFIHREQHFGKKEYPIDTFALCAEILGKLAGKSLQRTYREHYELDEEEESLPPQGGG